MFHADTIVALSTPVAAGLRAIVRLSGPRAFEIVRSTLETSATSFDHGRFVSVRIALKTELVFDATIYPFCSPRSSTGEEVAELHVPASSFLVSRLLETLIERGARQAEPGEFTARAFFNGKLDLTAAEGVAATISASNRTQLDAARSLLCGELARRLTPQLDTLISTLALVEVGIDFTDEDVTFLPKDELQARLGSVKTELRDLLRESARIERLSHEPRIVITGRPNAGKSTLLNALSRQARAVVSDVAGTTRDALSAPIDLPGGRVTLVDVAGIEEAGSDAIGRQMQESARRQIETADAVVLLVDASDDRPPIDLPRSPSVIVYSKIDLAVPPPGAMGIDARHSVGLEALRKTLDQIAFGAEHGAGVSLALNARHVVAIEAAEGSIDRAMAAVEQGGELVASEIRQSIDHLGGILGRVSPDEVLGRIFSSFCIGK